MIPNMNHPGVLDSLRQVGRSWSGKGAAVECGTWLGGTLAPLAAGLVEAGYDRDLYSFDRWTANLEECGKAEAAGVAIKPGDDLTPLMLANVTPIYPRVVPCRGKIEQANWIGEPIEVFVMDAAKKDPGFSATLREFGRSWIPGVTVVALLDFYFYLKFDGLPGGNPYRVQHDYVLAHADAFDPIDHLDAGSARFFRYVGGLFA